jgi:hypothetical protein
MDKDTRNWLILITLIAVAILAAFWATATFWFPFYPLEPLRPRQRPPLDIFGDVELFYTIKAVVSTVNVALLVFLLLMYGGIYQKTRSAFTIGLIIFSAIFLLNVLASNPFVIWIFGFRPFGLGPFAMLPDLFTFVALIVLLYLSAKY